MLTLFLSTIEDSSDESLFESIYHEHRRSMFSAAYSVVENSHDAEDVLQNTFLKIATNMDKVKKVQPKSLRAYLMIITKNSAIDFVRAKKHDLFEKEDTIELMSDPKSLEKQVLEQIEIHNIVAAIHKLKSPYKETLILFYVYDHSHTAIAELTGRSTQAVRQQVSRGKAMLVKLLKGDEIHGIQQEK